MYWRFLKTWKLLARFIPVVFLVFPGLAGRHGDCPERSHARYSTATETTITGTVEEVKQYSCEHCDFVGTHLLVKTAEKTMEVMLGPSYFLENRDFAVSSGDPIEVTGSKVRMNGDDGLLAREVKKGEQVLVLRDKDGRPKWASGPGHHRCRHAVK